MGKVSIILSFVEDLEANKFKESDRMAKLFDDVLEATIILIVVVLRFRMVKVSIERIGFSSLFQKNRDSFILVSSDILIANLLFASISRQ